MKLRRIDGDGRLSEPVDMTIKELIEAGVGESQSEIGRLEHRVDMLMHLVAYLIERRGLTTEELIQLTGNEFRFEEDD